MKGDGEAVTGRGSEGKQMYTGWIQMFSARRIERVVKRQRKPPNFSVKKKAKHIQEREFSRTTSARHEFKNK